MIAASEEALRARVSAWVATLGVGEAIQGESAIGGGSLPGQILPTWLLGLPNSSPTRLLAQLRTADPAVIARIQDERVVLDPRTILPEQEETLLAILQYLTAERTESAGKS
jgi:L-seryl-tRNA(Ser) seleniumtransferase